VEERKGNFTMNRRTTEISQCELTVMKCIWDLKAETGEVTCAQVMEKLKEDYGLTYKDTTVYTLSIKALYHQRKKELHTIHLFVRKKITEQIF
jgi:predicted transcriptional regulator